MNIDIKEPPYKKDSNLLFDKIKNSIYIVYLLLMCLIIFKQYQNSGEIEKLQVTITDTEELRKAIQKPLEGKWRVKIDWNKFHKDSIHKYLGEGIAFFYWNCTNNSYQIYITYSHYQQNSPENLLVTGVLLGDLNAEKNGMLRNRQNDIILKYIFRTGKPPFDKQNYRTFNMFNLRLKEKDTLNQMEAEYKFPDSEGKITFYRN